MSEDTYRGPSWWSLSALRAAGRLVPIGWLAGTGLAVALALLEARFDWSAIPVHLGPVTLGFTIYPPLTVVLLLAIWLGPHWGMIPAFVATFASALSVGIPPGVATVFALATPLEVLILWGSMVTLNISPDLRRWSDLRRFLAAGLIAATASSVAALIWSDSRRVGLTESQRLWQGWLLGDLAQIALVVAPVLRLAGPRVRAALDRHFRTPPRREFSYRASVLLTILVSLTLVALTTLGARMLMGSLQIPEAARTASGEPLLPRLREIALFVGLMVTVLLVTTGAFSASMARLGDRERALALRDALTGCFNRRAFYRLFRREADRARRLGAGLSLLSLDIDHFKDVNDAHGHGFGDEVLRMLSRRVRDQLREPDLLFRWGGEEFLILLPHSVPGAAGHLAERVRASVAAEPFRVGEEGRAVPVTVSLGVAGGDAQGALDADEMAERADAALLSAKRGGRNRVVSEGPVGEPLAS